MGQVGADIVTCLSDPAAFNHLGSIAGRPRTQDPREGGQWHSVSLGSHSICVLCHKEVFLWTYNSREGHMCYIQVHSILFVIHSREDS
ncbi:hypothetical protein SCLCIDRAFT_345869 [Scleroderma citrinum Foug A]|uniref:Uncharacterized protein n=1 Tax=Scleroderma citrinum Foug A TaxID=1036808 RepID=A0A0C3DF77_9AGAM|nr:hypothetical protein SCLCIDRAFT_345869 [Scleroderma citrinum Foug A]